MNVKCLNVMIVVLMSLHVTTFASITQKDVQACTAQVKERFNAQQNTGKIRLTELHTRKVNEMKELRDARRQNLLSFIQKEKDVLSVLKQSAIRDNFNVTLCKDSSTGFDQFSDTFQLSTAAILEDYRGIHDDRLALKLRRLKQKFDICQQQTVKKECLDEKADDCEASLEKDVISNLESSYISLSDKNFADLKVKVNNLYETRVGQVLSFSGGIKSCYRNLYSGSGIPIRF